MRYPFLENNQLILIDYLPGSSGQLLMRLWAEADATMSYDNPNILSETSITGHPSTREIDYDNYLPKKLTNWFMNRCDPANMEDWLSYFEIVGTAMIALRQRWKHTSNSIKFYETEDYQLAGQRVLIGIHSWRKSMPMSQLKESLKINRISIIPATEIGRQYQLTRCRLCYPLPEKEWQDYAEQFNNKSCEDPFDLCTLLANRDHDTIVSCLKMRLGSDFLVDKEPKLRHILHEYHNEIVAGLNVV